MGRKSLSVANGPTPSLEWDPSVMKELWHLDFEKEPVNDERWSCIVSAAIPAEAADDDYIQVYGHCVNTGLRKAVKVISMADVMKLLKGSTSSVLDARKTKQVKPKTEKLEKAENLDRGDCPAPNPRPNQIVGLAASYAKFTDTECKLPSDLMAAVIKYLILNLKDQNCLQKRVDAVKARKMREKVLKAKFIRSLRPFEVRQEERKSFEKTPSNILELEEPINDEPFGGPDLYILLTDIYDVNCFPELVRLRVPFLALTKISLPEGRGKWSFPFLPGRADTNTRKAAMISEFWEKIMENCFSPEGNMKFKNIAMMRYLVSYFKSTDSKTENLRNVFNELTWMQYFLYNTYRQHQVYLRNLHVQRLIMSLEPLDLARCDVYNAICDLLLTGQPLTPVLILHAMIEQVVAGVPETESVALEYELDVPDSLLSESPSVLVGNTGLKHSNEGAVKYITPCTQCRGKVWENICDKLRKPSADQPSVSVRNERTETSEETSLSQSQNEGCLHATSCESARTKMLPSKESTLSESLSKILAEKKAERDTRKDKKWKGPELCFFGDHAFLQMYHSEPRILTAETVFRRYLKKLETTHVWSKYPELPPEEKAFFNFHFLVLKEISKESEDSLRTKIHFLISMKLMGLAKSYLYRGEEETSSETVFSSGREKIKEFLKVKFEQNPWNPKGEKNLSSYFFKTFSAGSPFSKKILTEMQKDLTKTSLTKITDAESLRKVIGNFNMTLVSHRSSGMCFPLLSTGMFMSTSSITTTYARTLSNLIYVLDLPEISNLIEPHFLSDKDEYLQLIQSFLYYEKLEPQVMTQRLLEAEENYNTAQYVYFTPTDSVVVVMLNDYDYRGVFYTRGYGVLPTPVSLRDFQNFVHSEILDWLLEKEEEHLELVSKKEEEVKAEEERKDEEYLSLLKREYCELSPEEKKEYLETVVDVHSDPEVAEDELGDLPVKPKFLSPQKISFVVTNFIDVRIETERKVHEFYSRDGTEVNVVIDRWLYEPQSLLMVVIKRPKLRLYYHQWLGEKNINTAFTFKTTSDIIFSFYKDNAEEEEDFNYNVNISWPTGLLVTPVFSDSGLYIRQSYLKVYRSGWDIEEEKSRCFLRNGEVLVFKENGDLDILCGNGTKYAFYESAAVPRYEIITTTGEIWEVRTKGPCRFIKKLRGTQKIYIGTDPKTQETYYRREDGLSCMLWPNGKLVTNYSDGTKITSTPYFDVEVTTEWTEEEKMHFLEVESKQRLERGTSELRSRTILRNTSGPKMSESTTFFVEPFVSISCSYLIEHPKYSTVFFNPEEPHVRLNMPQEIRVTVYPEGNYEVSRGRHFLTVQGSIVEFYLTCNNCNSRSTAVMNFDDKEYICKVTDFFQKGFFVERNGNTTHHDSQHENSDKNSNESHDLAPSKPAIEKCINKHMESQGNKQKCFAFGRDMSGVEFVHKESLAHDFHELPEDTYFDLHSNEASTISHTVSSPYYRIGYENWVMDYEDAENSLPTNLKKKDLKELGCKENPIKLFKYPFPKHHDWSDLHLQSNVQKKIDMPKVTVARTIKCLSPQPDLVIQTVQKYIMTYQKKAREMCNTLSNSKVREEPTKDYRYIKMRLKKIALTLNQSLAMYPHLCTQFPSTEKDIHYFGHFINLMEEFKDHTRDALGVLPNCKNIPKPLPKSSDFPSISEENEPL